MTLWRALYAEALKLKRTFALKMVLLAPGVVVALIFFFASQAPFSTLQLHRGPGGTAWTELLRLTLQLWGLLMLPLYITLESALIAGLDHTGNQWKSLFARPVPRWTIYAAKLLFVMAMVAAATLFLVGGILIAGAILSRIQTEVRFPSAAPVEMMLRQSAGVSGLGFLAITIQHWVSLRWRSFGVATGFGIIALVTSGAILASVIQQQASWEQYFPWSLPMLVFSKQPHNIEAVLSIAGVFGLLAAALGCADFCRREVS